MPLPAIRQRVKRLEGVFVVDRLADYPPLSHAEIVALAEKDAGGEKLTAIETARLIRQCPYVGGELIIGAYRGEITFKRLIGIDMADV
jgi:hypothetical protein